MVDRSKLRVESRKWLNKVMEPKKFGEKVAVDHSGAIESKTDIEALKKNLTKDELKALQAILKKAQ